MNRSAQKLQHLSRDRWNEKGASDNRDKNKDVRSDSSECAVFSLYCFIERNVGLLLNAILFIKAQGGKLKRIKTEAGNYLEFKWENN